MYVITLVNEYTVYMTALGRIYPPTIINCESSGGKSF